MSVTRDVVPLLPSPASALTHETRDPVVLDIETVPLAAALEAPYPEEDRPPPAHYKAADAIARWQAKDRESWHEDRVKVCSLNPRLGRVLCVGTSTGVLLARRPDEEPEILRATWALLHDAGGRVVTWNGSWDLRFLLLRSLSLNVPVPIAPSVVRGWLKRYTTDRHVDCKAVLTNWEPPVKGEGLSEWAVFLGLDPKTAGMTGADVYRLACAGEWTQIVEYCAQDVATTRAIYARLQPVFGV